MRFVLSDDSMIIDCMSSAAVMMQDYSEIAFQVHVMTSLLLIRVAMMHLIKKNHLNIERTMNILSFSGSYILDSIYISQFSNKWS